MSIFQESDYLAFIRAQMRGHDGIRGYQAKLARAAGVHGSYFSRVLAGRVHLTPDQAANLCKHWALNPDETDYFLALVQLARAGTPALRTALERTLRDLRRKQEDLSVRFRAAKALPSADQAVYYSNWHLSAIHILLLVPGHQTPPALASRLGLPIGMIHQALENLATLGLAEQGPGKTWRSTQAQLHLARESPWIPTYHAAWRNRTISRVVEGDPNSLHFTGIHAASRKDFAKIRGVLVEAIDRIRPIANASPEEDAFALMIDWDRA